MKLNEEIFIDFLIKKFCRFLDKSVIIYNISVIPVLSFGEVILNSAFSAEPA